jgi:uncharacterized membrane protein YcaP (DUF421 family)
MDLALRATAMFFFMVVLTRVVGRRELSSLSPFDLVLLIVLGDAIQQGLTQDDYSFTGALIVVVTIAGWQVATSYFSFRWGRARAVLEGMPIIVIQDGRVIEENLRRERMTQDELAEEMRLQQIARFEDVEWAILERNGSISFIQKSG